AFNCERPSRLAHHQVACCKEHGYKRRAFYTVELTVLVAIEALRECAVVHLWRHAGDVNCTLAHATECVGYLQRKGCSPNGRSGCVGDTIRPLARVDRPANPSDGPSDVVRGCSSDNSR